MTVAEGLSVVDLTVRFGGLVAVDQLSFDVPPGRLTGLIGPNGAGKTSTFNACTGVVRPAGGSVSLDGVDVSKLSPHARARLGLGRTFQRMELFERMSVAENIGLAWEARHSGARMLGSLFATRSDTVSARVAQEDAIERCRLGDLRSRAVGTLSTGQRRMVELARALAGGYTVLLLDEPSSGLDVDETGVLGEILVDAVDQRGLGILLVEHDMSLVMSVCAYLYVLDFGQLIESGSVREVVESDVVRAAYLGTAVS